MTSALRQSDLRAIRKELASSIAALQHLLAVMDAVLAGKAPRLNKMSTVILKPHPIKELLTAFDAEWQGRYKVAYVRTAAVQEAALAKGLLATQSLAQLIVAFERYLRSNDEFFLKARHPFPLFCKTINQWLTEAPPMSEPRTVQAQAVHQQLQQRGFLPASNRREGA